MRRSAFNYLILFVIVVIVNFLIPRLLPGSPVSSLLGDDPGSMTAAEKMGILKAYNLDRPLWGQFLIYIKDLFTLNWGYSFSRHALILDLISAATGWTLLLALSSLLLSSVLGILLGFVSALWRKKRHDLPLMLGATFLGSLPSFWVAIFLIAIFSVRAGWFPFYGAYSMWADYTGFRALKDVVWHLVLPVIVMSISSLTIFFMTARFSVLSILNQDYIKMAKMRGISRVRIYIWYIMRNGMLPVFTVIMMDVGYLLSGSVVIEAVFSYPGLGMLMYDAVSARDYPLMQYGFLLSSFVTIVALFFADMFCMKINPLIENNSDK